MTQSYLQGLIHVQSEAFWIVRSQEGVICAEPILESPSSQQVEIQTLYSGFNGETERVIFHGQGHSEFAQSLQAPFLLGQFPAPEAARLRSCGGPNSKACCTPPIVTAASVRRTVPSLKVLVCVTGELRPQA